jgi:uncharacterized repeat protein (TIGR03843 family)
LPPLELDPAERRAFLRDAELEVLGRMPWSSNATLLAVARAGEREIQVIYKPRRGERPLWDFPTGTLCQREVATYELSALLGWSLVPETVLRDGPVGVGMVQEFVDHDPDEHYFTLLEEHEDVFRRFAVFDVLANNADRKGGHCLQRLGDGTILGIDHGLTFHPAWKLRTVIWEFGGEPIPPALAEDVCRVVDPGNEEVEARLGGLLSPIEMEALRLRADELLRSGKLPNPDPGYHSLPWPLV